MDRHNDTNRIITFYSNAHLNHSPQIEFLHGQNVPYFEKTSRIENIRKALQAADLINLREPEKSADVAVIEQAHDAGMIDYLRNVSANVEDRIRDSFSIYHMEDEIKGDNYFYESIFPPVPSPNFYIYDSVSPIGKGTYDAVMMSATLAVESAEVVLNGEKQAFALCRPPGHHAGRRSMGGYCYFNNASIAAYQLKKLGNVAILDIDYHHGNGTQDIFWDDPEVLVVNIHADPKMDYPYYAGHAREQGGGSAVGTNLNLPLPHGVDADQYLETFRQAVRRILQFQPSALVVSLGFDTYQGDPIGLFSLDIPHYETLGREISALGLPTVYIQEGGYAIDQLGEMAVSFFRGVLERR